MSFIYKLSSNIISTLPDRYFKYISTNFPFRNQIVYIDFSSMKYETYRFTGADGEFLWEPYEVFIKLYYDVPNSISRLISGLTSVILIDKCRKTTNISKLRLYSRYIYYTAKQLFSLWAFDISFAEINDLKITVFSYHHISQIYYHVLIYKEENIIEEMSIIYDMVENNAVIPGAIALGIIYGHIQEHGIEALDKIKIEEDVTSANTDYETQKSSSRISIIGANAKKVLETLSSKYGICFISKHNILLIYYDEKTKKLIRHIGFTTGHIKEYRDDISALYYYKPDSRKYQPISYEIPALTLNIDTINLTYCATLSECGRYMIENIPELQYCALYEIGNKVSRYNRDISNYVTKELQETHKLCLSSDKYIYTIADFETIKNGLFLLKVLVVQEGSKAESLYAVLKLDNKSEGNLEVMTKIYYNKEYEDEDIIILKEKACLSFMHSIIYRRTGEIIDFEGDSRLIVDTKQYKIGIVGLPIDQKINTKIYTISKTDNQLKFLKSLEYSIPSSKIAMQYDILGNVFLYIFEDSVMFLDMEGYVYSVVINKENKSEYTITFLGRTIKISEFIILVELDIKQVSGSKHKHKKLLFILNKKKKFMEIIYGIPVYRESSLQAKDLLIGNRIYLIVDKNVLSLRNKKVVVSYAEKTLDCMFSKDYSNLYILVFDVSRSNYFLLPFLDDEIYVVDTNSVSVMRLENGEPVVKEIESIDRIKGKDKETIDTDSYKIMLINNRLTLGTHNIYYNIVTDKNTEVCYVPEYHKPVIVTKVGLNIVFSHKTAYDKYVAIIR